MVAIDIISPVGMTGLLDHNIELIGWSTVDVHTRLVILDTDLVSSHNPGSAGSGYISREFQNLVAQRSVGGIEVKDSAEMIVSA